MVCITKIHGIKFCEAYKNQFNSNFVSVMPTNCMVLMISMMKKPLM